MSGFACIFNRDGRPVSRESMEKMVRVMAHRGPDAQCTLVDDALGLGQLLLKTGSGSCNERMPARSDDGRLMITGDLRLDDRKELWGELGMDAPFDPAMPDSQLVLRAYEKWGEQFPCRLAGDFALVLWDARLKKILAVRDPFGVKPFYFHLSDKLFIGGSEIKALATVAGMERKLNESWIIDYLAKIIPDRDSTVYESFRKLPPATCLAIAPDSTRQFKYWELDPGRELHYEKESDYVDRYRELFFKAVDRRLDCSYPIGGYLSGGLDSSSIVCASRKLLREQQRPPMHTFSAVYSACTKSDESSYIQSVLDGGDLTAHFFDASDVGPLSVLTEIFPLLDEPRWAYNVYLNWNILKLGREAGLRVVLDGYDGDTTLSHGERLFSEWAVKGQWVRLFSELRAFCRIKKIPFWPSYRRGIWEYGLRDRYFRAFKGVAGAIRNSGNGSKTALSGQRASLLSEDVSRRQGLGVRARLEQQARIADCRDHKLFHLHRLQHPLLAYHMENMDLISTFHGIEPRFPFCDRDLVEFCFALPWHLKLHKGTTRFVARKALSGVMPDVICQRPDKGDLAHGFDRNLNHHDRNLILESLDKNPLDILDRDFLKNLKAAYLETTGTADEKMLIWRLVCFNLWQAQSDKKSFGSN